MMKNFIPRYEMLRLNLRRMLMKIMPSVIIFSLVICGLLGIIPNNIFSQSNITSSSNANISNVITEKYADLVTVDHAGKKRVVLLFYETESKYGWDAIDLLENQYGYHLESILSSGVGSQGNPTRFFAVLSTQ